MAKKQFGLLYLSVRFGADSNRNERADLEIAQFDYSLLINDKIGHNRGTRGS